MLSSPCGLIAGRSLFVVLGVELSKGELERAALERRPRSQIFIRFQWGGTRVARLDLTPGQRGFDSHSLHHHHRCCFGGNLDVRDVTIEAEHKATACFGAHAVGR